MEWQNSHVVCTALDQRNWIGAPQLGQFAVGPLNLPHPDKSSIELLFQEPFKIAIRLPGSRTGSGTAIHTPGKCGRRGAIRASRLTPVMPPVSGELMPARTAERVQVHLAMSFSKRRSSVETSARAAASQPCASITHSIPCTGLLGFAAFRAEFRRPRNDAYRS